jgi:pyruvate/2-oxoglutarate dehydrogenase complex dihydrolipoamide acyltransferase (E2) component
MSGSFLSSAGLRHEGPRIAGDDGRGAGPVRREPDPGAGAADHGQGRDGGARLNAARPLPDPLGPGADRAHVTILTPTDGVVRSIEVPVGASVREGQEIAQLDRAEAAARLKIAQANVKEIQAMLKAAGTGNAPSAAVIQTRLEAAQVRADIAQLELDRCTFRAPFAGRLLAAPISPGQYVAKRALVAEPADVSSLHALVPFDRSGLSVGGNLNVSIEGQTVAEKVQATLPIFESLAPLRELSKAFTATWITISNVKGTFEPGQRVLNPSLPTAPIATIPAQALHDADKGVPKVQMIRNEYAADVAVRILGHLGPDWVQVSGPFRKTDALIGSLSVPLIAGTLIRFGGSTGGIEATNPNPAESGEVAGIMLPRPGSHAASDPAAQGRPRPGPQPGPPSRPGLSPRAPPPARARSETGVSTQPPPCR